jgi:hypothetical protein
VPLARKARRGSGTTGGVQRLRRSAHVGQGEGGRGRDDRQGRGAVAVGL